MSSNTYVRAVGDRIDGELPKLQEFDKDGSPVGPVFRPASNLVLVSKQVEIIRRASNSLKRVPGDTVAVMSEPTSLRPVIGVHMRVDDIVSPHLEDGVELHNPRTGNMRFQWFTHKWVTEDIYVEIQQDDECDERPVLQPSQRRLGFPNYEIGLCAHQFTALLAQIEASPKCLITLNLTRPSGIYMATWQEPAKLYGSGVPSRKADGTSYDETIPHFGIAEAMDLQVSTFPGIQPIETVYLRWKGSDRIDDAAAESQKKEGDPVSLVPEVASADTRRSGPARRAIGTLTPWLISGLLLILLLFTCSA